jgi:hypothetical protein
MHAHIYSHDVLVSSGKVTREERELRGYRGWRRKMELACESHMQAYHINVFWHGSRPI